MCVQSDVSPNSIHVELTLTKGGCGLGLKHPFVEKDVVSIDEEDFMKRLN